jgi:hypothetical protein
LGRDAMRGQSAHPGIMDALAEAAWFNYAKQRVTLSSALNRLNAH